MPDSKPRFLRMDSKTVGNLELTRKVFLEGSGHLIQELDLLDNNKERLLGSNQWNFKVNGNKSEHLSSLDAQWEQISEEFAAVTEHAKQYAMLKTESEPFTPEDIAIGTLRDLADTLLHCYVRDDDIAIGKTERIRNFLIPQSRRYMLIRKNGYQQGLPSDSYEKSVMDICMNVSNAMDQMNNIQDLLIRRQADISLDEHSGLNGLEFDNGGARHDVGDIAMANDEDEDINPWESDADSWKKEADLSLSGDMESLGKERYKHFSQLIAHLNTGWVKYLGNINSFIQASEELWLATATQIRSGGAVEPPKKTVTLMNFWMGEAQDSYAQIREVMEDIGLSDYDIAPFLDIMEDSEKSPHAIMQKLVSLASRPDLLKDAVSRALPRQREL